MVFIFRGIMKEFYCEKCELSFESELSLKMEYYDYTFGNCWKYIAYCPNCGQECSERSKPKAAKKSKAALDFSPGCANCMDPSNCGMNW